MEDSVTRWYVQRGRNGQVIILARIREDAAGVYPEIWNGHGWEHRPSVMRYVQDPLAGDEVDQAEADAIARSLSNS